MNSDTAGVNSDNARANCDKTIMSCDWNTYSDCTGFYSDRMPTQSDCPKADNDHPNADSDYERVNYMRIISYFDYIPPYSEQMSISFDTSLHHSDYPITNLLTFTDIYSLIYSTTEL